uniref:Alpha-(1,6)-fucosyltransferase n=1 Tax=Ornithodoros turicata TaxID=34597 RepID=A0A2R5LN15_9ACAR
MGLSLGRLVICLLLIWLVVLLMISGPLFHNNEPDEQVVARLTRAVGELESLKQQNEELRSLLHSIRDPSLAELQKQELQKEPQKEPQKEAAKIEHTREGEPSKEYEVLRRKVENGIRELWFYARAQLNKVKKSLEDPKPVDRIIQDLAVHKRTILTDLEKLREADGYDAWRQKESRALRALVEQRLSRLQNPKHCPSARKVLCSLNKGCGYGCQVHHAAYCLIVAYGTQRTLILRSKGWRYATHGWETVYQPVSNTCVDATGSSKSQWSGPDDDVQVVELPIIDNLRNRPPYLPLAIPQDLGDRLTRLHGNPPLWWVSQMMHFLMRPQKDTQARLDAAARDMDFRHPVVGVHVRRTDKIGTEAGFHSLEEYMEYVDDYFDTLELQRAVPKRRVYLATDDSSLLGQARNSYPHYHFYGDVQVAQSASLGKRYSSESLKGIVLDIHMLSKTDYLVCTFSSQVCRVAYELMQLDYVDASDRFRSLDDIYYFGGQRDHNQIAVANHTAQDGTQIDFRVGDILGIAGNHWDGYSKGINRRTGAQGLYPAFKAVDRLDLVPLPTYGNEDT